MAVIPFDPRCPLTWAPLVHPFPVGGDSIVRCPSLMLYVLADHFPLSLRLAPGRLGEDFAETLRCVARRAL